MNSETVLTRVFKQVISTFIQETRASEKMNNILSNSGLIHIRDQILGQLDINTLGICLRTSKHWHFWIQEFLRFSLCRKLDTFWDGRTDGNGEDVQIHGWNISVRNFVSEASVKDLIKVHESLLVYWQREITYGYREHMYPYRKPVENEYRFEYKLFDEQMQLVLDKMLFYHRKNLRGGNLLILRPSNS